jgi:hypothetical protein
MSIKRRLQNDTVNIRRYCAKAKKEVSPLERLPAYDRELPIICDLPFGQNELIFYCAASSTDIKSSAVVNVK